MCSLTLFLRVAAAPNLITLFSRRKRWFARLIAGKLYRKNSCHKHGMLLSAFATRETGIGLYESYVQIVYHINRRLYVPCWIVWGYLGAAHGAEADNPAYVIFWLFILDELAQALPLRQNFKILICAFKSLLINDK